MNLNDHEHGHGSANVEEDHEKCVDCEIFHVQVGEHGHKLENVAAGAPFHRASTGSCTVTQLFRPINPSTKKVSHPLLTYIHGYIYIYIYF